MADGDREKSLGRKSEGEREKSDGADNDEATWPQSDLFIFFFQMAYKDLLKG